MTMLAFPTVPRETLQVAHALLTAAETDARRELAKAATPALRAAREARLAEAADELTIRLDDYFDGMAERVLPVAKAIAPWDPDLADWAREAEKLLGILNTTVTELGPDAYANVNRELGLELEFRMDGPSVKPVMAQIGNDVTGINDVTRQRLRRLVADGVERGYSIGEIVRGVPDDNFTGLRDMVGSWKSTSGSANARATMIARTETGTVWNHLAISGYEEAGYTHVLIFDGLDCGWTSHDDLDKANGSKRTLAEAREHPLSHPNCARAVGAYVP